MNKFTREHDKAEFVADKGVVYKVVDGKNVEIRSDSVTATRIRKLVLGTASNGVKKKFGLYKAPPTKQEKLEAEAEAQGLIKSTPEFLEFIKAQKQKNKKKAKK